MPRDVGAVPKTYMGKERVNCCKVFSHLHMWTTVHMHACIHGGRGIREGGMREKQVSIRKDFLKNNNNKISFCFVGVYKYPENTIVSWIALFSYRIQSIIALK